MARDLLLEVGCEEIPSRFFPSLLDQLAERVRAALAEARLAHGEVRVFGTARRLAAMVSQVAEVQPDARLETRGPSLKAAFGPDGQPTRALLGFAASQGVAPSALVTRDNYLYAARAVPGRPAAEVLGPLLERAVLSLDVPRTMRWGAGDERFVRPIRWLVALFGQETLPLAIGHVGAETRSRGHRFLHPDPVSVERPDAYLDALRAAFVLVDPAERRSAIWRQVEEAAARVGGRVEADETLLDELTFLVEWPTAFVGSFDRAFLAVPAPVLITSMKHHQRYFPVTAADGALLPHFIGVANSRPENLEAVRRGNEKVLAARLTDARFFWDEDLKRSLGDRVADLGQVRYHERLGSLGDKAARLERLAGRIAQALGLDGESQAHARRAGLLAKADLVTAMVGEFPELEGVMGRYYAERSGEPEPVAVAIEEHVRPRSSGGELPETPVGRAVALADKYDALVGAFRAGLIPTGSQDPYALRRAAQGVVAILAQLGSDLDLAQLVNWAAEGYGDTQAPRELRDFLAARLEALLTDEGWPAPIIQAVLAKGDFRLATVRARVAFLSGWLPGEHGQRLLSAYRRAANLARQARSDITDVSVALASVRENRLDVDAERILWQTLRDAVPAAERALEAGDLAGHVAILLQLADPIDHFLDGTMVMVDDPVARANRLALLKSAELLFTRLADLSKLPG